MNINVRQTILRAAALTIASQLAVLERRLASEARRHHTDVAELRLRALPRT